MPKFLREALAFIADLIGVSPVILAILGVVVVIIGTVLSWITQLAYVIAPTPLPLLIILTILALYPIAKLIEYKTKSKAKFPISYSNLGWKYTGRLIWKQLIPVCPHCHCEVITLRKDPGPFLMIDAREGLPDFSSQYIYECPEHGKLLTTEKSLTVLTAYAQSYSNKLIESSR